MANSRGFIPTTEYIQSLYNEGNIEELRQINETLAKRTNERMRQLEKHDFDSTAAYQRAKSFIDKSTFSKNNRFSRSKNIDAEELVKQVKQEANFLRWQTSTVAGELKRRENIFASLTDKERRDPSNGKIIGPVIDTPSEGDLDEFKKSFLDFLDNDAWEELKKHMYYSDILKDAGAAVASGASVEKLAEAINEYKGGNREKGDLITIWDNWTNVTEVAENEADKR